MGIRRVVDVPALDDASFRILVDSVRDYAIYMLDPQGYVISWNSGAERIMDYTAAEIVGRHFKVFYPPEDRDGGRPEQELETARETGRYEEERWRLRKDGSRFRAHVIVTALRNVGGELLGYAKVVQDTTIRWEAEQKLRRSEERFRLLVEQIRDYAIFMLSPDGRISSWNRGAQRIKGYDAAEVIGQRLSMFYPPEDLARGRLAKLMRRAINDGVAHDVGWRIRKDGSRFWADVTLNALHDTSGQLYGYVKIVRDLTERVEAEELARAYEAAREAIHVRDEFLSIASHELRTPLTATHLQLQSIKRLLQRDPTQWDAERVVHAVDRALGSTDRLSQLIDTLLDVSRISAGRIRLEPATFDLVELVRTAVDRLAEMIREASCEVRIHAPAAIEGRWDRLRIEQGLMNLIANACKYAPGSRIEVGVERQGERVRLWVSDTGPGIAAESLEKIFGRFERVAPEQNHSGLGLGLFVTRQIAKAHGGCVQVDSRLGEGSTFTIELPLETSEEPEEPEEPEDPEAA